MFFFSSIPIVDSMDGSTDPYSSFNSTDFRCNIFLSSNSYLTFAVIFMLQVTFTDNIRIYCDYSSTVASRQMPIICFWAITLTEGNSPWRRSVFYWRTKLNIPKISSYFVEITNAPVSTGFTDFTTNVGVTFDILYTIISHLRNSFPKSM